MSGSESVSKRFDPDSDSNSDPEGLSKDGLRIRDLGFPDNQVHFFTEPEHRKHQYVKQEIPIINLAFIKKSDVYRITFRR